MSSHVKSLVSVSLTFLLCLPSFAESPSAVDAAEALLARAVPEMVGKVVFVDIPDENGKDVFELQTRDGKLIVSGNNGVSMASGLYWYLKHYCNSQITFRDRQVSLPDPLPQIDGTLRVVSPHKYRYYFNYCAFSYTLAWWHWSDWERMIDLMALYGVNAPLSVTGQEGVWRNTGKRLGLSDEQMQDFFVGPGFLPFGWMGCIDRWAGPLPNSWIDDHVELQKKILQRQRELGMTPILQGFTGHVPRKLQEVNPEVKLVQLSPWIDFEPTYFIDPSDPYFIEFGRIFLEEQTKLFGTNHLYAADTFIEMPPTNNDPEFIRNMGRSIYEAMRVVDPDAIWVLQSWPFVHHDTHFWQPPQAGAFFMSVPQGRLLILDLFSEVNPGWSRFEGAFFGQPWAWGIIQNFGGQVSLHGAIDVMANDMRTAMARRGNEAGNMAGIAYVMEALCYNPIIDEFIADMVWRHYIPDTAEWRREFVRRRYGTDSQNAQDVWEMLHHTVYQRPVQVGTALITAPSLSLSAGFDGSFLPIWRALLDCADEVGDRRTYHFDVVNVTRHALVTLVPLYVNDIVIAFGNGDREALKEAAEKIDELIYDINRLLATDSEFLLGKWLEDAKRWGHTEEEKRHYEWNARKIITLWGQTSGRLDDYAGRQWSGMMSDYYARRWQRFYESLDQSLADGTQWNAARFHADLMQWQAEWAKETTAFTTEPSGENPVAVAKALYEKYATEFERVIPAFIFSAGQPVLPENFPNVTSLTTGKPATASDTLAHFRPELANDGIRNDPDSYWACDVASTTEPAWWMVDLEQPTEVARVVVTCYYVGIRYYGFFVEGSLDGENWTMLADWRDNTELSTIDGYDCRFDAVMLRYLRVTLTHNSANTGRHLVEVMAFGPAD